MEKFGAFRILEHRKCSEFNLEISKRLQNNNSFYIAVTYAVLIIISASKNQSVKM
jgi:hypothetical protein